MPKPKPNEPHIEKTDVDYSGPTVPNQPAPTIVPMPTGIQTVKLPKRK